MTPRSQHGWASERFDRRHLLRLAAGTAVAASVASLYGCSSDSSPQGSTRPSSSTPTGTGARPNILVIFADDQRYDTVRFMPNLRRLMSADATTFTQARQSTSECSPARATFLRGQFAVGPEGHGVRSNSDRFTRKLGNTALASWLEAAGYYCGIAGKYFDSSEAATVPAGWAWWRALVRGKDEGTALSPVQEAHGYGVFDGSGTTYPDEHQMQWQTKEVLGFIDDAPEPWFLWDCPTSPHFPPQPTPRRARAKADDDWPVVDDTAGKPSWMARLPRRTPTETATDRAAIADTLREVMDLDDHVAAVWKRLQQRGVADRTTVVYSSDNSATFLDFRLPLFSKNLPYDVSSHVPLVCMGPGFPAGLSVEAPVSAAVDVTATCLALAGAEATVPQHGVDLAAVAADPGRHAERVAWGSGIQIDNKDLHLPPNEWVVADQGDGLRKLIRYEGVTGTDRYEAYDLDTDPNELRNWGDDADRRSERDRLESALDEQRA